MYSFDASDVTDITLDPNLGSGVMTIGLGSAMVDVDSDSFYSGGDPNGQVIDVEMWIIGDSEGNPLPPLYQPQAGVRQSVGDVTEDVTLYYGTKTDIKTTTVKSTGSYSAVATKDKDFAFVPSAPFRQGETRSIQYDVSSYYVVSWTTYQPLFQIGRIYGKRIAHAVFYNTYLESFFAIMTRKGTLEFYDNSLMGMKKNPTLQGEWDTYLSNLWLLDEDKTALDLVTFGDDQFVVHLRNRDAVKIGFTWDGHLQFTEYHDVAKVVSGTILYTSAEMIWDGENNLFIPLMSDGVRHDIVDAWAIPSLANDYRVIKHYADGTFELNGSPISVTGTPFDFFGSDDVVYAVYKDAPYRLEKITGTGALVLHVNNYSYYDSKISDQTGFNLCSTSTANATYINWVEANYTAVEEFYDKPPCPYRYSRLGYPTRSGSNNGIELLIFQGSTIKSMVDGTTKVVKSYISDDAYFTDVTNWSATDDQNNMFDVAETCSPPMATFGGTYEEFRLKIGTQEDTKEWFTWADVRNLQK